MKIFTYSGRILTGKRETCKQQRLDLKFDEQGFEHLQLFRGVLYASIWFECRYRLVEIFECYKDIYLFDEDYEKILIMISNC